MIRNTYKIMIVLAIALVLSTFIVTKMLVSREVNSMIAEKMESQSGGEPPGYREWVEKMGKRPPVETTHEMSTY